MTPNNTNFQKKNQSMVNVLRSRTLLGAPPKIGSDQGVPLLFTKCKSGTVVASEALQKSVRMILIKTRPCN